MQAEAFEKAADSAVTRLNAIGNASETMSAKQLSVNRRIDDTTSKINTHKSKLAELYAELDKVIGGFVEFEKGMGRSGDVAIDEIRGTEKLVKEIEKEEDAVASLNKRLGEYVARKSEMSSNDQLRAELNANNQAYRDTRFNLLATSNAMRTFSKLGGESGGMLADLTVQLTMFRRELTYARKAGSGAVAASAVGLGVGILTTVISSVIDAQEELKKARKEAFDSAIESISGYEQESKTIQKNFEIIRNGTADTETLTAAKKALAESLDGVTVGFDKEGNAILASNDVIKDQIELLENYNNAMMTITAERFPEQQAEFLSFWDLAVEHWGEETAQSVALFYAQQDGLVDGFKVAVKAQLDGYNDLSDGAKLAVEEILAENQSLILSEDGVAQAIAIINATLADKQAMMEHQKISQHIADWNQKVALSAHNANEAIKESNKARIEEEMANAKNLLNILYAEINAYDTLANIQLYYKLLKDASDLSKTISNLRASLNSLGTNTPPAIGSVSKAARDATSELNNLGKAVTSALKERYAEQQKAEEARIEASIKSWDEWEEKTVGAIQSQMDALDALEKQQESEDKRAEYERKKQALELQKAYEKDAYQREQLQKEINRLNAEEQERVSKEARDTIREELKAQIDAAQRRADAERDALDDQKAAIKDAYSERTKSNALAAEAEKLILKSSQDEIIKLIESYSSDYQSAGKTLGERLAAGFSGGAAAILSFVDKVQSGVNAVQSRVANNVTSSVNAFYASRPSVSSAPVNVTVNFNTPVDSPVEVRREIEKVMDQVAAQMAKG